MKFWAASIASASKVSLARPPITQRPSPSGVFFLGGLGGMVLRRPGALDAAIAMTQGASIVVLSGRPRTPQRGVQCVRVAQPLFRRTLLRLVEEAAALEHAGALLRRDLDVPGRQEEDLVRDPLHPAVEGVREAAPEVDQPLRKLGVAA